MIATRKGRFLNRNRPYILNSKEVMKVFKNEKGIIFVIIIIAIVLILTILLSKASYKNESDEILLKINQSIDELDFTNRLTKIDLAEIKEILKDLDEVDLDGFGYKDELNNIKVAVIENDKDEDADKVFLSLLNVVTDAKQKDNNKYDSGDSFLKSNVVLKRSHVANKYYTYLIISTEHEKIEAKIKENF